MTKCSQVLHGNKSGQIAKLMFWCSLTTTLLTSFQKFLTTDTFGVSTRSPTDTIVGDTAESYQEIKRVSKS